MITIESMLLKRSVTRIRSTSALSLLLIKKLAFKFHKFMSFHLQAQANWHSRCGPKFSSFLKPQLISLLCHTKINACTVLLYEVPFVKYVLHALYGQLCAFPILSHNGNEKSWTAFCGP